MIESCMCMLIWYNIIWSYTQCVYIYIYVRCLEMKYRRGSGWGSPSHTCQLATSIWWDVLWHVKFLYKFVRSVSRKLIHQRTDEEGSEETHPSVAKQVPFGWKHVMSSDVLVWCQVQDGWKSSYLRFIRCNSGKKNWCVSISTAVNIVCTSEVLGKI